MTKITICLIKVLTLVQEPLFYFRIEYVLYFHDNNVVKMRYMCRCLTLKNC